MSACMKSWAPLDPEQYLQVFSTCVQSSLPMTQAHWVKCLAYILQCCLAQIKKLTDWIVCSTTERCHKHKCNCSNLPTKAMPITSLISWNLLTWITKYYSCWSNSLPETIATSSLYTAWAAPLQCWGSICLCATQVPPACSYCSQIDALLCYPATLSGRQAIVLPCKQAGW